MKKGKHDCFGFVLTRLESTHFVRREWVHTYQKPCLIIDARQGCCQRFDESWAAVNATALERAIMRLTRRLCNHHRDHPRDYVVPCFLQLALIIRPLPTISSTIYLGTAANSAGFIENTHSWGDCLISLVLPQSYPSIYNIFHFRLSLMFFIYLFVATVL